jgi:hypothetical protein
MGMGGSRPRYRSGTAEPLGHIPRCLIANGTRDHRSERVLTRRYPVLPPLRGSGMMVATITLRRRSSVAQGPPARVKTRALRSSTAEAGVRGGLGMMLCQVEGQRSARRTNAAAIS